MMGSQTSGNISTMNWMISTSLDESSLQASISRMGQALREADKGMDMKALAKKSAAYEPPTDVIGRLSEFSRAPAEAEERRFAEMQDNVAKLDAAYEASEQQRLAAISAQEEADEREFASAMDQAAKLDAAEEANEAQRLKATQAQTDAVQNEMTRGLVRVMTTEQRINHEYQQRLLAIDAIEGATVQQTAALRQQADVVRQTTMDVERQRGNLAGVGGAGRIGTRIQEFGRGFEDFTVGFSMAKTNIEGVAMGLRGSANNAAQLAASFNPMVGAAVAIGASLATVIVPMVARWLWDTKELEASQKRWEENLKLSGKEAIKVAETLAKMRGAIREDAEANAGDKGKGPVAQVKAAEKARMDAGDKAIEQQRSLARAEITLAKAVADEKAAIAAKTRADGVTIRGSGLKDEFSIEKMKADKLRTAEVAATSKKNREMLEAARDAARAQLLLDDTAVRTSKESEMRLKGDNMAAIAKAEEDVKTAAAEKLQEKLDDMNDRAEKNKIKSAERDYLEMVEKIKALKQTDIAEETRMIGEAASARNMIVNRLNAEAADKANKIFADADKERNKQKEDDEKSIRDKIKEQLKVDDDLATAKLDREIAAKSEEIDALQERMQKAGNAAGPSAAMVMGTQAAESAINRALSGSRSVENDMKSLLKVQEKALKELQNKKQLKVASI